MQAHTINTGSGSAQISIGAGMDLINLGAGISTVTLLAVALYGNAYPTISGIVANDVVNLGPLLTGTLSDTVPTKLSLGSTAAFSDYLAAATSTGYANILNT